MGHKLRQLAILRDPVREARGAIEATAWLKDFGYETLDWRMPSSNKLVHMLEERRRSFVTGRTRTIDRGRGVARVETAEGPLWAFRCPNCAQPWFVPEPRVRDALSGAEDAMAFQIDIADV
ncbi:hypothetical protein M3D18_011010 [Micrococcus luteus]|nr:hypothetical protein [Micrococcus luteus]CVN88442.1 Uncharacterised protein [Streptococcus pneumoniae]